MAGSLSTLVTYKNTLKSIPIAFLVGSVMALIAITYLIWHQYKRKSLT
jgi:uncharacterized membrane protein AbrB (regulator of aidB expression)